MIYKFRCPDCTETFKLSLKSVDDAPDNCPVCDAYVGGDVDFVPSQVNIGTAKGKAADIAYRQMEQSSIDRAEMAGDPALKITNMNDNLRAGDVAAKPIRNAVTEYMEAAKDSTGFQQLGLASSLPPAPRGESGARALGAIQAASSPRPSSSQAPAGGFWGGKT